MAARRPSTVAYRPFPTPVRPDEVRSSSTEVRRSSLSDRGFGKASGDARPRVGCRGDEATVSSRWRSGKTMAVATKTPKVTPSAAKGQLSTHKNKERGDRSYPGHGEVMCTRNRTTRQRLWCCPAAIAMVTLPSV
jgi:hypothetical protein